jgi:phosphate transport system substrate-binding protein
MKTSQYKYSSILPLAIVLALAAAPKFQGHDFLLSAIAQSPAEPSFPPPTSVPAETSVRVAGSNSMAPITQALKQGFEQKYPGAKVNHAIVTTNDALQALKDGKIDLATSGRPLTKEEKAAGLTAVPVARHKIALFVKDDSPFQGTLTIEQFAQIFRGEITNWIDVKGIDAPVRIVDRPETSDTRQAFLNYDLFRAAPFQTGESAITVKEDRTEAVVEKLGTEGLGYAIAEQVINRPGIRIVSLFDTFPDDPKYPFSQPLTYVYKGTPSPAVNAFLGYASIPETAPKIEEGRVQAAKLQDTEAVASLSENPNSTVADATNPEGGNDNLLNSLWWLLLPLLGLPLLAWWLKGRMGAAPVAPAAIAGDEAESSSRIVLTPLSCRDVYAYWEVSDAAKKTLREQGGRQLLLRLYDVTGIDVEHQPPHSMRQFECREGMQDTHLPIALDDRDYLVELGYVTEDERWLSLTHSAPVRVPKCDPLEPGLEPKLGATAAAAAAAIAATSDRQKLGDSVRQPVHSNADCRIILAPRNCRDVYAYWELSQPVQLEFQRDKREKLSIRLCDVTGINPESQPPHSIRQFEFDARAQDVHLPIALDNRDYLVELGYAINGNRWFRLGRSEAVRVPPCNPTVNPQAFSSEEGAQPFAERNLLSSDRGSAQSTPELNSQIHLESRGSSNAYAFWTLVDLEKNAALNQGGQKIALRLYDVTNINLDYQPPHNVYEYQCSEADHERYLSIPISDRDYLIELGYVSHEGRWLKLARSAPVHIP